MGYLKNMGHQVQEFVYDFAVDGGSQAAFNLHANPGRSVLPVGAIIHSVKLKVLTAFTSGGSATMEWGNGDDPNGYSGTAIAVASLTVNSVFNGWDNAAALIWDDTNDHQIEVPVIDAADGQVILTINTADMTAGKCVIEVEFSFPKAEA